MLLSVALVLNALESILPSVGIPGVRLGLSNIPLMFAFFYLGIPTAASIGVAKCCFIFLTRGYTAAFIGFGGFLLSFCFLVILYFFQREKNGFLLYSVTAAVAHNMGQLAVVAMIYGTNLALSFVPILGIAGVIAGVVTSFVYKITLPILKNYLNF